MQNNWTCFGSSVGNVSRGLFYVSHADRKVPPRHKPALFVWICFNTPLWAQLVSLGNVPYHHPSDPGSKIAYIHRQIAWWEFQKWRRKSYDMGQWCVTKPPLKHSGLIIYDASSTDRIIVRGLHRPPWRANAIKAFGRNRMFCVIQRWSQNIEHY